MKKERTRTRISIGYYCIPLLFSILLLSTCTGNYLFDDEEPASRLSVSGTVRLGDGLDPSGTFIWLDGLDIHTTADASGNFTLELPPQQSQAGGGLTGDYRLYAYVGNYQFQSYSVVLRDGSIQYGVGDVDTNGRIPEIIILDKLVDIRTTIEPNTITEIDSWHTPDTGWQTIDDLYRYHLNWIDKLPGNIAKRLRFENARDVIKKVSSPVGK